MMIVASPFLAVEGWTNIKIFDHHKVAPRPHKQQQKIPLALGPNKLTINTLYGKTNRTSY